MYFCQTTCTHLIPLTLSSPVDESFCCEFILFCLLLLHYVSWKVVMADVVFNLLCPCPQMLLTSSHTFLIGTLQTPPNVHIFSHMYQLPDPHIHLSNFMNRPKKMYFFDPVLGSFATSPQARSCDPCSCFKSNHSQQPGIPLLVRPVNPLMTC